jgi:Short C-terminal domain
MIRQYALGGRGVSRVQPGMAQLFATAHLKTAGKSRVQVLTRQVTVMRQVAVTARQCLDDAIVHSRVGYHELAARPQDARELTEHSGQISHVGQRERADHQIHLLIGDRQGMQVAEAELRIWDLGPSDRENLRRGVGADYRVASGGKVGRVPPGSAGGVQRDASRHAGEQVAHDGLLKVDQVVGLVVVLGPGVVAFLGRDRAGHRPVAELVGGVKQLADLGDPGLGELAVVLPVECAQERDALEPEQIRHRMLVHHRPMLGAGNGPVPLNFAAQERIEDLVVNGTAGYGSSKTHQMGTGMADGHSHSAARRVGGAALMLLGVALIGYGSHYLVRNGTCSSTGYVSYGPVPKCSGAEGLYITSVFFLGPALAFVGWAMSRLIGWLWPAVGVSVGIGLVTIGLQSNSTSGADAFGLVGGVSFFALAVLSVVITLRKKLRPPPAALGSQPAFVQPASNPPYAPSPPYTASGPATDPLDRIARLAELRDSGAITEEEFEREKAKLLAQM